MSLYKISITLLISAAIMFIVAVDQFTTTSNVNPIMSKIGEICFILWLPTIIIAVILILINNRRKSKK